MKGKISLPDLLVHNDPEAVNRILSKYGVRQANDKRDAVQKLNYVIARHKEGALESIAKEHPHRDLILKFSKSEDSSSADGDCGCGGHSSAEGDEFKAIMDKPVETPVEIKNDDGDEHFLKLTRQNMVLGVIGLITLALVIDLTMKKK